MSENDAIKRISRLEDIVEQHDTDINFLKETHRVIMHATNRLEESIDALNRQIKARDKSIRELRSDIGEIVELKNLIKEVVMKNE